MMNESRNADLISLAIAASDRLGGDVAALHGIITDLRDSLSAPVEGPFNAASNAPLTREEVQATHLRAHRPGRPGKIEGDPELEAFILARIDTMTFAQIVAQVRATFPPDRRCSVSGLGRWWQKRTAP